MSGIPGSSMTCVTMPLGMESGPVRHERATLCHAMRAHRQATPLLVTNHTRLKLTVVALVCFDLYGLVPLLTDARLADACAMMWRPNAAAFTSKYPA